MRGIIIVMFFISCATVIEKPSSAEISITAAENQIKSMPDSPEKTIIQSALSQSRIEIKQSKNIISDLSAQNKSDNKKIISLSESSGKGEGYRNVALLFTGIVVFILVSYLILKLIPVIRDAIAKVPKI